MTALFTTLGSALALFGLLTACSSGEKVFSDKTGLSMDLSKNDQAYLAFPEYRKVTLSKNGKNVAVSSTFNNKSYISILDRQSKKIIGSVSVGDDFNVGQFFWVGDDKLIISAQYVDGYLKGGRAGQVIFSVDANGSNFRQIFPKKSFDRSKNLSSSAFTIVGKELIDDLYLLVAERRAAIHSQASRLSLLNVVNGKIRLYDQVKMRNGGYALDNNDQARIAFSVNDDETVEFFTKNLTTKTWSPQQFWSSKSRQISILGFSKDNSTFYFLGDNKKTLYALYKANITPTGQVSALTEMFSYPEGDVLGAHWDREQKTPLYVEYGFARPMRKYFSTSKKAQLLKSLSSVFPGESVYLSEPKGDYHLALVRSDKRPTSFYLYNSKSKAVDEFLSSNEKVRSLHASPAQAITFKARDGLTLQGYFYKPKNWTPQTPMVVHPHGGPYGVRDTWGYNGDIQFLVSKGYSVLQINFRGSSGRGYDFEKLGYKKQGSQMQNDIADGVQWVNRKNWATKGKACLWGISYGGYTALMSVQLFPELFSCAIGFGGVYDYDLITKEGDTHRSKFGQLFFERTMPKSKEARYKMSPISLVKTLQHPVYILHGKEDVRVTISQARTLKKELEKYKKNFKYQEFPDVGHWFVADQVQKNQTFSEIRKFLDQHLKK